MATHAQTKAHQANSEMSPRIISEAKIQEKPSTGPKTGEGKATVAHNAVKHALTGATVLLPSDDAAVYQQHTEKLYKIWQPADYREELLVQSIVDTEWRLQRIPLLIAATWALARVNCASLFADQPESLRAMMIEAHINETKGRELRNLALQENRLTRKRDREVEELKALQAERRKRRDEQLRAAVAMYKDFKEDEEPFDPAQFGFEFSIDEIEQRVAYSKGVAIHCRYPEQYAKYFEAPRLRAERLGDAA